MARAATTKIGSGSNFDRLLSSSRKYHTNKIRTSCRRRAKPSLKLTPAQKKALKTHRDISRKAYKEELAQSQHVIHQETVRLNDLFPGHSVDYYMEEILQISRLTKGKRKSSRWGAFVSLKVRSMNDGMFFFVSCTT